MQISASTVDGDQTPTWQASLQLACDWTINRSMIHTVEAPFSDSMFEWLDQYGDWRGAFRGEYAADECAWDVFCPIWHGGQAVKALALAHEFSGEARLLQAAHEGADFIMRHTIREDGPDQGLILAYEKGSAGVNTSAQLECLDGLFELGRVSGDTRYIDTAIANLQWIKEYLFLSEEGLFRDDYVPGVGIVTEPRGWRERNKIAFPGRPLLDDGVFLKGHEATGDESLKAVAVRTAERLLADEDPAGNWKAFHPAKPESGVIHPRHAYWWGRPMWMVHQATGASKYSDACRRSAQWYVNAMRRDGGMFRETDGEFNTTSFGHAASGIACAAILWLDLKREYGDTEWDEPIRRALGFCRGVQFTQARDENLQGAILEKVLPPKGSDRPPWRLRDVGTFFYIQALVMALRDAPELL